jgi:DNA topoisomerase I
MKRVIICESPAKKKKLTTIARQIFPGDTIQVVASFGHIRDLPRKQLGVDVKNGFRPQYEISVEKKKAVSTIRKAVKDADVVYLAADPDREGEAIAWHVRQVVKPKCTVRRVTFNAFTPSAVKAGFDAAGEIDMRLVQAQEARRIVDRLVGYKVSPVLWDNIDGKGLSAGRVQSVALRLVVERHRTIAGFTSRDYYSIWGQFSAQGGEFAAKLVEYQGRKWDNTMFPDAISAQAIVDAYADVPFTLTNLEQKPRHKRPPAPFTTSTLQQAASSHLGFAPDTTMKLAQALYENGMVTYMRTDSVAVSSEGADAARTVITDAFGDEYLPYQPRKYKAKSDAQEAHECIRPTDCPVRNISEQVVGHNDAEKLAKLYALIWLRFIASQMADARYHETIATVSGGGEAFGLAVFQAKGRVLEFDGFLKVYTYGDDTEDESSDGDDAQADGNLPPLIPGETLETQNLETRKHVTKPPARFSEASLVKTLESNGVGRPSTFAATLATIKARGYVKIAKKKMVATDIGCAVNDFLVQHFPVLFEPNFTARMEAELDKIAAGQQSPGTFLTAFWSVLMPLLATADGNKRQKPPPQEIGDTCPQCGNSLVIRNGKNGAFVGCSGFPNCRYTKDHVHG